MIVKRTPSVAAGLAILAHLQTVAAHGFPESISGPNGQWFPGFDEPRWNNNKYDGSAVLIPDYEEPTYDVWSSQIACGPNPKPAQASLNIEAGQSVSIRWLTHNNGNRVAWVHTTGEHRAFIAPTPGGCQGVDVNAVQFTELDSRYTGPQTYQNDVWPVDVLHQDRPWDVTIPDVSPGYYLLRDELTAFHFSGCPYGQEQDGHKCGTEFYPACFCIQVTKGGGSFDMSQANTFPGGYGGTDPGHYNPQIFSDPGSVPVAKFNTNSRSDGYTSTSNVDNNNNSNGSGNNGGSGDSNNGNGSPSPTSSASSNTTPSTPHCKKRKSKRGLPGHHKRMVKRGL